jgi:hypothetical protein
MRLLFLLPLLLAFSGIACAQTIESDSTFLVPVPGPNDKSPTFNRLTPEQAETLSEQHGIYIVQVVDPPNTYRWNDGTETITFAPEINTVAICRYEDEDGNRIGYMIFGFDESGNLPSKTKGGLLQKLDE